MTTLTIVGKFVPSAPGNKIIDAGSVAESADAFFMKADERAAIPQLGLDIEAEAQSREAALIQEAQDRAEAIEAEAETRETALTEANGRLDGLVTLVDRIAVLIDDPWAPSWLASVTAATTGDIVAWTRSDGDRLSATVIADRDYNATQFSQLQTVASDVADIQGLVVQIVDPWAPAWLATVVATSAGDITEWSRVNGDRLSAVEIANRSEVETRLDGLEAVAPALIVDPWAPAWLISVISNSAGDVISYTSDTGERWPGGGSGSVNLTPVVAGVNLETRKRTALHLARVMRAALLDNAALNPIYASGGGAVTMLQATAVPSGLTDIGNLAALLNAGTLPVRTGGGNPSTPYGTTIRSAVPSLGFFLPSFEIEFDGTQIGFNVENSGTGFRVIVDGYYIGTGTTPTVFALASGNYFTLTFATAGIHKVTIEREGSGAINAVYRQATSQVWKPGSRQKFLFIGDSYTGSTGTTFQHNTWERRAALRMGVDFCANGVGGSGYVADGQGKKFGDATRLAVAAAQTYDVIVIAGGINDATSTYYPSVQANALALYQALRVAQPNALIVVLGAWPGSTGPSTGANSVTAVEQAVQAAFNAWADNFSLFIPVSQVTADNRPWIFGTGRVAAANSTGNSDKYIGGTDGTDVTHPNDLGHDYLGDRSARNIAAAVEKMAANYQILTV